MTIEKRNIFLTQTNEALPYVSTKKRFQKKYPIRNDPSRHANYIMQKLSECQRQTLEPRQVAAIRYKEGTYLEFSGLSGFDLSTKSLENQRKGIRLLNVRKDGETEKATVYIPSGQETYFLEKVKAYADSITPEGKPKNNDLVRSIEDVKLALLDSFWIGKKEDMPSQNSAWCEIWLRYEKDHLDCAENDFITACSSNDIEYTASRIIFPERVVRLIRANHEQLKNFLDSCSYIAEMRRAPEPTDFFYEMSLSEQREWVADLLSRTVFGDTNSTICLLDTGITYTHQLLSPAIIPNGVQTVDASWGIDDHAGHGTEMAGISLYFDLKKRLTSSSTEQVLHKIESVKILPPSGSNEQELYGAITEQAVALAEIENPQGERTICMAITAPNFNTNDGSPTSWSGAIDKIASGADGQDRRLVVLSAGNVEPAEFYDSQYPTANFLHSVENPGQAWNALTVGAYTEDILLELPAYKDFSPIADVGDISPYSSTSFTWDNKWPIKPDILLNGGNAVTNGHDNLSCSELSLLTTNSQPSTNQFSTIWGTSSASAQAAWISAQLMAEYPGTWPETIRALIVHSARWTPKMQEHYNVEDQKTKGRRALLRVCGYGIPDLQRAIQCQNNAVNLIVQGEIQPFIKENGQPRMNEMHIHRIPWPSEVLRALGETPAEMRVTLSYFIEPGPGEKGWKDRYRYPSHGLRFDVINSNETIDDFKKRINIKMRGDNTDDRGDGSSGSERWYLGSANRDVGSIHSDFITCNAIDLSNTNYIAVYPVIGWWRERSHLGYCNNTTRYSLIVSISTPETDVDLYTPIITKLTAVVPINIS